MSRPRRRALSAFPLILSMLAAAAQPTSGSAWPPSSGLLIGEVVTGGSSGSDEWVEIHNAADSGLDLAGLEIVYVTASGKTVTRKLRFADERLGPGGRYLLANAEGSHAPLADATYAGGLSATGGSLVLRIVDGPVLDSLSWGNAASDFVEGAPGEAPPAGSSLERRPGGADGNHRDTNDNQADTTVNASPVATGRGGDGPAPTFAATPRPTAPPTASPTPHPTATPSLPPTPVPTRTPDPTVTPTAEPPATPDPPPAATAAPPPTPALPPTSPTPPAGTPTPAPSNAPGATFAPTPDPDDGPGPSDIASARVQGVGAVVTTMGTVTVEPGRILGDRTLAIADGSGGIFVRLTQGTAGPARGDHVRVTGELASPFGNLELRLRSATDLEIVGDAETVVPTELVSTQIGEATEGDLVTTAGTIVDSARRSSGAISLSLRDDAGDFRVYLHAGHGVARSELTRGRRLTAIGLVGQRASRSGADDGHRVWPRDAHDITSRKRSGPDASAGPGETPDERPPRKRIAALRDGMVASILGVVTSPPGLIDGDGRRVTVADGSGAILVRFPADAGAPAVGTSLRVAGKVGTWFGAPQLEVEGHPITKGKRRVRSKTLRRLPAARDEWRLVRVDVTIVDVARDGDTWRVEARLADGRSFPVAGLSGSGIPADGMDRGRRARVTGIVRRAHPQAGDQRFAIAPRDARDIRLGARVANAEGHPDDIDELFTTADASGIGRPQSADRPSTTLARLERFAGRVVRVGGRLQAIDGRDLVLDDGTARRTIRLPKAAGRLGISLREGDVLNVVGRVDSRRDRAGTVMVTAAADVRRAATLGPVNALAARAGASAGDRGEAAAAFRPGPAPSPARPAPIGLIVIAAALALLVGSAVIGTFVLRRGRGSSEQRS